jgi:ubiquinone/menaquinone biosynthesis C-methylase UbiE
MKMLDKISDINNRVCPWWLCHSFDNPLRRLIHNPERMLKDHVRAGMTVVDVGCGMGYFTLGMARLAGPGGKVIAVDLQQEMLSALDRRAQKGGLSGRIVLHRCRPDRLGVEEQADFVLCFWMAHEVPDKPRFFGEIFSLLKPDGRLLLVEPRIHVSRSGFDQTLQTCLEAGFRELDKPGIALSRAVLMEKAGSA